MLDKETVLSNFLKTHNIDRLPVVIVFDRDGRIVIERDGRNVIQDMKGKAFHKWIQQSSYANKYITDKIEEGQEDAPAEDNEDN